MARSLLKKYNGKRDFKLTKEPAGKKVTKKKSRKLTFVVQEHHASHLHYDFRLEMEGVLKSWAVPKGPSLDPADKRLAVQTEDHPLEYGKFHGTIPKGEYGGGEVFIWDNGTWTPKDEDPVTALEKGKLEFSLKGKRLKGKFILIRTHYKGKNNKKNWLLIKRHDEEEIVFEERKATKKVTRKKKSLAGSDKWPGFIPPELPRLVTSVPEGSQWIHEMKYDGYRMQAQVKNGIVNFYTRSGLDWASSFPYIMNALANLNIHNAILDGEVVAMDDKGRTNFQQLQNSLKAKSDKHLRYYIFDLLYLDGEDLRNRPLLERKELLRDVLKGAEKLLQYSEHLTEDGKGFFELSCEHQLEGVISKQADSTYHSGRNDLWVKTKCGSRQEFVIGGWTEPQGGRIGIGALLLGIYEDGKLRYSGKVGTGFNTKTLQTIAKELSPLEVEHSPFKIQSPRSKSIHWVKPVKVCEVSFGNWTNEGILRAPVFMGMREDKKPKVIHRETAKPTAATKEEVPMKVSSISSPDKVLFHEDGKTKKDVAEFYQKIGKVMLPYLEDRPLTLVRCPQGSRGKCFFQKHITGKSPASFHPLDIKEEKGTETYITINSVEGLLELVQLNAFELHAWNSHRDYMSPDQIVMDFDPGPGVPWKTVVKAAFELKEILDDLNLKSFVKLTGGKGIHVHIPIAPLYNWDQIKSFTQTLALEMVSRNPKTYVANMSKGLRKNKIFVDYLRNGYGATAVVPYSLRAKGKACVALPLTWEELKKVKSPDEYSMEKALRKIKTRKRDPWAGMMKLHQEISILTPAKKEKMRKKVA